LETLIERQGINGFYKSREARTACCFVRKVEPLNRALNRAQGWVVGLRADQSANRQDMGLITAEAIKNLLKLSPLFDWTRDKVSSYQIPESRSKTTDSPDSTSFWIGSEGVTRWGLNEAATAA
jgi:phosphoadenosine phosphosulfate reductase